MEKNYTKLMISLGCSFIVMYGVMFLNVADANHIYLSLTRTYMTLLMVAPMAIIMLLVMRKMYKNKTKNLLVICSSIIIFIVSLVFLRNQVFISDVQYMKAMIPHHSSAILTSNHADIQDSEVRRLADDIIKAQEKEIAAMKQYINRLENE